ncbi:Uncharacterised protein [Bordetella pertussis]|nr:Uncharacterised protein [Bordetella pertussis]
MLTRSASCCSVKPTNLSSSSLGARCVMACRG